MRGLLSMLLLCLLFVGCGGGGGSTGPVTRPEPTPTPMPMPPPIEPMGMIPDPTLTPWRNNATAEDLLDHWNAPQVVTNELDLAAVSPAAQAARRAVLGQLIAQAEADPSQAGTILRNIDPADVEIVGERDGITYGQWKGGPAGTLNIDFDWRFAQEVDADIRATAERVGKIWSYRLADTFAPQTVEPGTTIQTTPGHAEAQHLTRTFSDTVTVDGILVAMIYAATDPLSSGGPNAAAITETDYEPWLGNIQLTQAQIDERTTIGQYWLTHIVSHELGHLLGITGHEGGWDVPSLERYLNRNDFTFTGPAAMRANGGQPVPFQWLDADRNVVPPNTPGAMVDYGHLGVCASLMAYCNDKRTVYQPDELDFAFLDDIGYDVLPASITDDTEVYGFGAWGQYSAWGVGVERFLGYQDDGGTDIIEQDRLRAGADAIGIAPDVTLAEQYASAMEGMVTWAGSLLGVDLGRASLPPVVGDAEVTVDLARLDGTATFDNLTVLVDGQASAFRAPALDYAISVTGNSFAGADERLTGAFFGPAHEEMGGVLHDRTPGVNLLGGFGGVQTDGP